VVPSLYNTCIHVYVVYVCTLHMYMYIHVMYPAYRCTGTTFRIWILNQFTG
jgi:hypothetical protein